MRPQTPRALSGPVHPTVWPVLLLVFACGGQTTPPSTVPGGPSPAQTVCAGPHTAINEVQGTGSTSPLVGTSLTLEGTVTTDLLVVEDDENAPRQGFYLQDASADGDEATSEGLFVQVPKGAAMAPETVAPGTRVRVTGTVVEQRQQTVLQARAAPLRCATGQPLPTPRSLQLPHPRQLESLEGMRVRLSTDTTVTGLYGLADRGEVLVAGGSRIFTATNGADQGGHTETDRRRALRLDDGRGIHPTGGLPWVRGDDCPRVGDTLEAGTVGVLGHDGSGYVLHTTSVPPWQRPRPRSQTPPAVPGDLRLVAFNVLNYFTTFAQRGAEDDDELARQQAKIVTTLQALDADIVGLVELENNGDGAIGHLTQALNHALGSPAYAFVADPPGGMGTDAIKVGFLYRPGRVQLRGPAIRGQDPNYARPHLAQTFEVDGQVFTVVVSHFKSKGGCAHATGLDLDQGDGQGCWNALRTRQAQWLTDFIDRLRQDTGDPDVMLMGDLNSYGDEDPIRTLVTDGLVDLVRQHVPAPERYSFIWRGAAGTLDYAFATTSLARAVRGAGIWHVNADEATARDYDTANPAALYHPDPFRASDHDPVLVGLTFEPSALTTTEREEP